MKPITFCIATAKNEKEYVTLLLNSLKDHTKLDEHEILVFIDSDNQNTYERLLEMQASDFKNMRIHRNVSGYPIGGQRNISIMFDEAKNNIVCYLQSDMVVGKDFDKHISANIEEGTVLACLRIEPPLHPPGPEKIVKDFGITPDKFDYKAFNTFVDELQLENRPNTEGHFAPFAVYKSDWFDKLGGFDTQFRCSREDSDTIIRMEMCGLKTTQSWNACVYHFTCVSSRGTDWFKDDKIARYKNDLQTLADQQELKRFVRKWGFFGHHAKPKYNIAFNINVDRFVNLEVLKWLEPYCSTLYLNDSAVLKQLKQTVSFESDYYANLRWNYTADHWESVYTNHNPVDFDYRILNANYDRGDEDVIVSFRYSELVDEWSEQMKHLLENINSVVFENEVGDYEIGPFKIQIKAKKDTSHKLKKIKNKDYGSNKFKFI
jgi:GT2 family glycosyltransferase